MSESQSAIESANDATYSPAIDQPAPGNPRRKLLKEGPRALSATELVTVVLGNAEAARRIVRRYGLPEIVGPADHRTPPWLREEILSPASTARLLAVRELARRAYGDATAERPRLTAPREVYRHVHQIGRLRKEHLVCLYLDAQNGLLHEETISVGSLNTTRTHPREILEPAIVHLAFGFILAHNHPSGWLDPSPEDVEFTAAVKRAGEIMGIELYDHVIVTERGYTSLRERGLL